MTSTAILFVMTAVAGAPPAPAPLAAPDSTAQVWVPSVSGSVGGSALVEVRASTSSPGGTLGHVRVRVHFDPSAITVEEATSGQWEGRHRVEAVGPGAGVLEVEATWDPGAPAPAGPVTFLALSARLVGSPGLQSEVRLEVLELQVDGRDVPLESIFVRSGFIRIF